MDTGCISKYCKAFGDEKVETQRTRMRAKMKVFCWFLEGSHLLKGEGDRHLVLLFWKAGEEDEAEGKGV